MQTPVSAHQEPQRLAASDRLDELDTSTLDTSTLDTSTLDTSTDEHFDRLTRVARRVFDAPIALVSLIGTDRHCCTSGDRSDTPETDDDCAFCSHTIVQDDIFVVPDATLDERFRDHPLVTGAPNVRFYAACPLNLENGNRLGALCIIDRVPRQLTDEEHTLLRDLAALAEHELARRHDAVTDPLTGFSNEVGLKMLGAQTLRVCNRIGKQVSLLCFDLAAVDADANQLFGVPDDAAVEAFTDILRDTFDDSDVIGRFGHEQFAVLTYQAHDTEFGSPVARLRRAVEEYNAEHTPSGPLLAYDVGSAIGDPSYQIDFDRLFSAATHAMRPQIVCSNTT